MGILLFVLQLVIYLSAFFVFRTAYLNSGIVLLIAAIGVVIHSAIFRFQRTTLGISRAFGLVSVKDMGNLQAFLTPDTLNLLYWVNTIICAVSFTLLGTNISWLLSVLYVLYLFIGVGAVDVFLPMPSNKFCVGIIEKHLDDKRKKGKSLEDLSITVRALSIINDVKELNNRDFSAYVIKSKSP